MFCSSWKGSHTCEVSPRSGQPFQRRFLKVFFYKQYGCWNTWTIMSSIFFSVDQFIPRWPSKFFILIGCSVVCMQLWRHNRGTNDIIKKKTSRLFPMRRTCPVPSFNFFFVAVPKIQRSKVFPTWLPHRVTYDVIIMIKTFYMSRRTYGENFVSIRQAVEEKMNLKWNKPQKWQTYVDLHKLSSHLFTINLMQASNKYTPST